MITRRVGMLAGALLILAVGACGEIDQTAKSEKIFASKKDVRAAAGAPFGGDRKKWEATLAERSNTQNEYLRTDVKK